MTVVYHYRTTLRWFTGSVPHVGSWFVVGWIHHLGVDVIGYHRTPGNAVLPHPTPPPPADGSLHTWTDGCCRSTLTMHTHYYRTCGLFCRFCGWLPYAYLTASPPPTYRFGRTVHAHCAPRYATTSCTHWTLPTTTAYRTCCCPTGSATRAASPALRLNAPPPTAPLRFCTTHGSTGCLRTAALDIPLLPTPPFTHFHTFTCAHIPYH